MKSQYNCFVMICANWWPIGPKKNTRQNCVMYVSEQTPSPTQYIHPRCDSGCMLTGIDGIAHN